MPWLLVWKRHDPFPITGRAGRRWTLLPALPLLLLTLDACGVGATGDACWSDFDCASESCTFGTCDGGLAGLLRLAADASRASSPQSADLPSTPTVPAPPPTPYCGAYDEATCQATPGCTFTSLCSMTFECFAQPGSTSASCVKCVSISGCPKPCELIRYCH